MATINEVHTLFADYVSSSGKMPLLKTLSQEIDHEIDESRMFVAGIKDLFKSIEKPAAPYDETYNDLTRHEEISQFLESGSAKLLLPDMNCAMDLDIDESIRKFRSIIDELKKDDIFNMSLAHRVDTASKITPLELDAFATSLDQLCHGLAGIRSINYDSKSFEKNEELETKLPQLCQEVELFTKMVQSKTKLSQCDEEWQTKPISAELPYSDIIKGVLTSINDLTFKFLEYKKMFACDDS